MQKDLWIKREGMLHTTCCEGACNSMHCTRPLHNLEVALFACMITAYISVKRATTLLSFEKLFQVDKTGALAEGKDKFLNLVYEVRFFFFFVTTLSTISVD